MKHLFTVSGRILKAVQSVAADKTDSRYYLHGIHAMRGADGNLVLEATDGKLLLRYTQPSEGEPFDLILPPAKYIVGETAVSADDGRVYFDVGDNRTTVKPVEAQYPYCDSIIPKEVSGELAAYQAGLLGRLLAAVEDIMREIAPRKPVIVSIETNGDGPGRIVAHGFPNIVALIGPWRL